MVFVRHEPRCWRALKLTAAADVVNAIVGIAAYVVVMLGYSTIYQATVKLTLWRSGVDTHGA